MEFPTLTPKWKSNGKPQTATGSRQHSLHEGEEIFKLISSKIESANKSVYVAASWFTDLDLFDALERRAQQNPQLVIKIVLDNNQSNYYLPFKKLVDIGAVVRMKKVKSSYGSMHSKYCIIDEASLISGSYNWSKNARNNNEENIIYTEDPQLVAQYSDKFNQLLESSEDFDPDNINKVEGYHPETASETNDIDKNIQDYEALLDKLIYAQVHSYDDLELRAMGKERCLNCSGFAGNVPQELDNVYTHFLRDIKVSNEKKELIKSSLFEQLERSKGTLDLKSQNEIALLEKETRLANEQIDREMTVTKSELVIVETEIENLSQGDKSKFTDEIAAYNGKIDELKRNSFRPKIAWYSFIPNILFLILVVAYCVIFYSSAAYILIFFSGGCPYRRINRRHNNSS
ncbi:phospholipase D-like domain-containing protein [Fulvivirga maritima]|uniref:phospholipase D-like domain-containing protein n=1 Tax=Fulvivirga maritima TaxID=2904247 RepID=UPI001F1C799B|nr:phospholipase D-like domain-containing protein [Fulvivirga maritima]UII26122.1 phospholipase D-like domain-containing protein [Fulvivirga maritima]